MNPDEPSEPHFPSTGDAELEARIVAWVLGEASAFEAEGLARLCAANPELQRFEQQIREIHGLTEENYRPAASEPWRLPPEKREKIASLIGEATLIRQPEVKRNVIRFNRRAILATAACLAVGALSWPYFKGPKEEPVSFTALGEGTSPDEDAAGDHARVLGQLKEAVSAQEKVVELKRQALKNLIRDEKLLYSPKGSSASPSGDDLVAANGAANLFMKSAEDRVQLEAQLAKLRNLNKDQDLSYAAGLDLPDNRLKELYPKYLDAKRSLDAMTGDSGLGPEHPSVIAQKKVIEEVGGDLDRAVEGLNGVLKTKLEITNATLARRGEGNDVTADRSVHGEIATPSPEELTSEFGREQRRLDDLKLKALSEETKLAVLGNLGDQSKPAELAAGDVGFGALPAKPSQSAVSGKPEELAERGDSTPAVPASDAARDEGREAYAKGDYEQAVTRFRSALQQLPEDPSTQDRRDHLKQLLADGSSALGEHYRKVGKFEEARELATDALAADPDNDSAKRLLGYMDDPIRTNPALTQQPGGSADDVRRGLYTAEGAYNLGKFDDAKSEYENVLRIDPYNKAARRGMEQVAQARADYYRAAYDQTRAELLAHVDATSETSVPRPLQDNGRAPDSAKDELADSRSDELGREKRLKESEMPQQTAEAKSQPLPELSSALKDSPAAIAPSGDASKSTEGLASGRARRWAESADYDGFAPLPGAAPIAEGSLDLKESLTRLDQLQNNPTGDVAYRYAPDSQSLGLLKSGEDRNGNSSSQAADLDAGVSQELPFTHLKIDGMFGVHLPPPPAPPVAPPAESAANLSSPEISASEEASSTFSLHVSDASFRLAKAALDRGEVPDPASIREEEFYNGVNYGDPSPARGEPVACVIEQGAHPVRPQRELLRIGVRTGASGRSSATPLNLVLLLDSSGSMEREDRHGALLKAVRELSGLLKEGDTVSVVGFSRKPRLLADRLSGKDAERLNQIVASSPVEGGTDLAQGLKLASELAERQFRSGAQNRVVLFTDGAANLGDADPESLAGVVEGLRLKGIAFDAAGFGAAELNDGLLERLTRHGDGRYYVVNRPEDAGDRFAKQLAGAFRPAAENVKVQVNFNPARVGKYRLAGFDEHRLKKEDFHNDAVDAAELAAEESGNALYEVETLPGGEGEIGEVSIRFRDSATGQMVERTWTIPYSPVSPAFDKAKPGLQLAGLALLAAEKLKGGPSSQAIQFNDLSAARAAVQQAYGQDPDVASLLEMIGKLR